MANCGSYQGQLFEVGDKVTVLLDDGTLRDAVVVDISDDGTMRMDPDNDH